VAGTMVGFKRIAFKQSAKPPASFATLALWRTFRDGGLSPPRFAELSFRRATMLSSDELRGQEMASKLSEGDSITVIGEVTKPNDNGTITIRLHG
jgi:hypothetical protein